MAVFPKNKSINLIEKGVVMKTFNLSKITILIMFTILFGAISSYSSTVFSAYKREIYQMYRNQSGKPDFKKVNEFPEHSMFVISNNEDMFVHRTQTIESSYYIGPGAELDKERGLWTVSTTSDVGNEYLYMFDFKYKMVKAIFTDKDGNTIMILFRVKAIFTK